MKKNKIERFQLGLGALLNIGGGVTIIGIIFIGVFSILNLYKIKSRIDVVDTTASEVSTTVVDVTKSLGEIDAGSNEISSGMGNIKSELEKSQAKVLAIKDDMQTLLVEPLGGVARNLNTLLEAFNGLVSNYENSINRLRKTQGATNLNTEVKSEVKSNAGC